VERKCTAFIYRHNIHSDLLIVDKCWQDLLLNQFHDVLPGSCIEFAAIDAWEIYENLFEKLRTLRTAYHKYLLGTGTGKQAIYNPLPWETSTVVFMKPDGSAPPTGPNIQPVTLSSTIDDAGEGRFRIPEAFSAALVKLGPSGYSEFAALAPSSAVAFERNIIVLKKLESTCIIIYPFYDCSWNW